MAQTPARMGHGQGGTSLTELTDLFDGIADDLAALRAAVVGITAKLDADAGVTDTDYAATHHPAARTHLASDE